MTAVNLWAAPWFGKGYQQLRIEKLNKENKNNKMRLQFRPELKSRLLLTLAPTQVHVHASSGEDEWETKSTMRKRVEWEVGARMNMTPEPETGGILL